MKRGEDSQGAPWGPQPKGLNRAQRLAQVLGARVGGIRAENTRAPEHISEVLGRLVEKWKSRESYTKKP